MYTVSKILCISLMAMLSSCGLSHADKSGRGTLSFQWKKLGQLPADHPAHPHSGLAGPVAAVSGAYLVLGGGSNFPKGLPWEGGSKNYYRKLYIYRLSQNPDTATLVSDSYTLPDAVGYPACVSTGKGILVAGGENDKGPTASTLLITIDKSKGSPVITRLPQLPKATSGAMATCLGDRVYFAGGNTAAGTSSQFLVLDLKDTARGWQKLPDLAQPTCFGVLYSDPESNQVYLAGGRKPNLHQRTTFYSSLFIYDAYAKRWQKKRDLPYAVSAATGVRFQDKLLLFGGDQGATFHKTEDLLIQIGATKDAAEKQALTEQKNTLQKQHPGFTHQILSYDLTEDRWELAGKLCFESQVTTSAILWKDKVIIPCGEIRAGVRYPAIIEGSIQHAQ